MLSVSEASTVPMDYVGFEDVAWSVDFALEPFMDNSSTRTLTMTSSFLNLVFKKHRNRRTSNRLSQLKAGLHVRSVLLENVHFMPFSVNQHEGLTTEFIFYPGFDGDAKLLRFMDEVKATVAESLPGKRIAYINNPFGAIDMEPARGVATGNVHPVPSWRVDMDSYNFRHTPNGCAFTKKVQLNPCCNIVSGEDFGIVGLGCEATIIYEAPTNLLMQLDLQLEYGCVCQSVDDCPTFLSQ